MLSSHLVRPLAAVSSPIGRWAAFVFTVLFWPFLLLPYWLLRYGAWGPGSAARRVGAFVGGALLNPLVALVVLVMWLRRAVTSWEPEWPAEFPTVVPDRVAARTGGENARRNPGRTAATAAALMIGIALVAFIATLTNGMKASNREAIEEQIAADYVVTSLDGYTPFVAAAGDALAASPVPELVTSVRSDAGLVDGELGRDRRHRARHDRRGVRLRLARGRRERARDARYDERDRELELRGGPRHRVGDVVTIRSTADRTAKVTVVGTFEPPPFYPLLESVNVSTELFDSLYDRPRNRWTWANVAGEPTDENRAQMEQAIAGFPDTQLETREEWIEREDADFNEFISFLYVMLTLAVFVSIFGMINTLVLSVYERTREIGMLRAIGMTRRQVRRMIRQESIITALIGAALGLPLGIFLAALVNRALVRVRRSLRDPVGPARRAHDRRDRDRDPGRDHARAPRREAEPARSHRLRVGGVTRFAIRGLLSRKLRTALTALAIVLGVAMISGTYVLTDSIDQAFDRIFTDIRTGLERGHLREVRVRPRDGSGVTEPTFDESLLDEVRALPAVAEAEGSVDSDTTQLIGDDGKAVVYGGAPNLGFSIADPDSPFNPLTLVEGEWPGPNEVIVDKETASKEDFEVGETIGIQAEGPVQRLPLSGIMQFSSGLTIGGATLAGFDLPTAQRLMRKQGRLDEIAVASKPGVADAELVRQIDADPPRSTQVQGVGEQVQSDAEETNEFITFLQTLPARVRWHRALRRLLRHRELAVDHDRPADARARHPAHARRLAAPGARLDHPRGARRRRPRLRDRAVPRAPAREGALLALRPRRVHAPEHRARLRDADGDRRAARGNPRHAHREPAACDPRDARAPRRRRARGRDPPARGASHACGASARCSWPSPASLRSPTASSPTVSTRPRS